MDKYIVVQARELKALTIHVNAKIENNGYVPQGGVSETVASGAPMFYQAMVKKYNVTRVT